MCKSIDYDGLLGETPVDIKSVCKRFGRLDCDLGIVPPGTASRFDPQPNIPRAV